MWIDAGAHQEFVKNILIDPKSHGFQRGRDYVRFKANRHTLAATSNWGTQRMPASLPLTSVGGQVMLPAGPSGRGRTGDEAGGSPPVGFWLRLLVYTDDESMRKFAPAALHYLRTLADPLLEP